MAAMAAPRHHRDHSDHGPSVPPPFIGQRLSDTPHVNYPPGTMDSQDRIHAKVNLAVQLQCKCCKFASELVIFTTRISQHASAVNLQGVGCKFATCNCGVNLVYKSYCHEHV